MLFDLVVLDDVKLLFAVINCEFDTLINEFETAELRSEDVSLELNGCLIEHSSASNKLLAFAFIFDNEFVCVLFVVELFTDDAC